MNWIEKMIAEQCPNGEVEWKTINKIGQLVRGNGLQKADFREKGTGCIHYGQIYTKLGFSLNKTLSFVSDELANKLTKVEPGDLVIACTSENVEDVCKSVVWLGKETVVTGGHACVFKHNENPKYIGYCFLTHDFFQQKKQYAYGAKVIDIKTEKLGQIKLPIPSLSIQEEIVSVLDKFSELIEKTDEEIALRQKQYEYYREKLLTFEKGEVEWKKLGDVCDITTGKKPNEILEKGIYDYINAGTSRSGYTNDFNSEGNVVTTPSRGQGGIGYVAFQHSNFWCGPLCYKISAKIKKIYIKFLYFFLSEHNDLILNFKCEGGTPALNRKDLATVPTPIPSLSRQQEIVETLDKFETLISKLKEERELRQKQYEYYREKLLTF